MLPAGREEPYQPWAASVTRRQHPASALLSWTEVAVRQLRASSAPVIWEAAVRGWD